MSLSEEGLVGGPRDLSGPKLDPIPEDRQGPDHPEDRAAGHRPRGHPRARRRSRPFLSLQKLPPDRRVDQRRRRASEAAPGGLLRAELLNEAAGVTHSSCLVELTNERRRRASGALQVHPRPRFACPSFAGHPCDLTLRPAQQASPHALASVPTAIRSPVGRCPESAAEYVELTQPRLNCLADLSGHTVHTVSGACGGPHYH
eukprot:3717243-Prymnesium_polylepis.2